MVARISASCVLRDSPATQLATNPTITFDTGRRQRPPQSARRAWLRQDPNSQQSPALRPPHPQRGQRSTKNVNSNPIPVRAFHPAVTQPQRSLTSGNTYTHTRQKRRQRWGRPSAGPRAATPVPPRVLRIAKLEASEVVLNAANFLINVPEMRCRE